MSLPFLLYKISHSDWPLFSNILIAKISLLIISTNLLSPGLHKEKKNFLGIIPTSLAATIDFFFLWWRMKQNVGFGFFFPEEKYNQPWVLIDYSSLTPSLGISWPRSWEQNTPARNRRVSDQQGLLCLRQLTRLLSLLSSPPSMYGCLTCLSISF